MSSYDGRYQGPDGIILPTSNAPSSALAHEMGHIGAMQHSDAEYAGHVMGQYGGYKVWKKYCKAVRTAVKRTS